MKHTEVLRLRHSVMVSCRSAGQSLTWDRGPMSQTEGLQWPKETLVSPSLSQHLSGFTSQGSSMPTQVQPGQSSLLPLLEMTQATILPFHLSAFLLSPHTAT